MTINWATQVITIEVADLFMTNTGANKYTLDTNGFRLALDDRLDDVDGEVFPDTHIHKSQSILSGVTYARIFEITNGYTVSFESTGSDYTVTCTGANHNLADVLNGNNVNLIVNNAAGLVTIVSGSGLSTAENEQLFKGLTKSQYLALK